MKKLLLATLLGLGLALLPGQRAAAWHKCNFNAGVNFTRDRYLGDLVVTYSDSAFWQDVLNEPYHGTTKAYTMVNGGFGVKWLKNRVTTSVKGTNLGNQKIQQHVFGDVIKRSIIAELRVNF